MTGTPFHESGVVFREERSLTVAARIGHAPPASCVAPALAPARCCELLLVPPPRVLPPPTYRRAPARTAAGPTPHRPLRCIPPRADRTWRYPLASPAPGFRWRPAPGRAPPPPPPCAAPAVRPAPRPRVSTVAAATPAAPPPTCSNCRSMRSHPHPNPPDNPPALTRAPARIPTD